MSSPRRSEKFVFFAVLGVSAFVGFWLGGSFHQNANADKAPYKELEKFSKVLHFVETQYVEKVSASQLVEGAIKGMLATLDPHSTYLSAELFKEMRTETSGKFGGVGIEVSVRDGLITVVAPIEDSPAFKAGIKAGDQIIRVDQQSTKSLSLENTISLMRGKPGSEINLVVQRKGENKLLEFKLNREFIKIQSVKHTRVQENIGYIRVAQFIEGSAEDTNKAIAALQKGSTPLVGLILDLRGNPGGLLDQAVKLSNLFIDEGPVVYTIGRDKTKKEIEYAKKGKSVTELPLVVLIDGSSASASEIVAGAIQDYGRGVLVGQRSFGKGSVQSLVPMDDESGLKLTVSRYYTPSGKSIQAKGIVPDVVLEELDQELLTQAMNQKKLRTREENLEGHFENESEKTESVATKNVEGAHLLAFEERVKKDFMVTQAAGILKTMKLTQKGTQKPRFELSKE